MLPRPFQPIAERVAMHPQPMSRSRMTSQMGSFYLVSRQHFPAYVIHECFPVAQPGEAFGVARCEHGLLLGIHLAAHMIRRDYPAAAGFGNQAFNIRYQLAHIPWPSVVTEQIHGILLEYDRGEIAPDKNRYFHGARSESRRPDMVSTQAIIQVASKAPFIDFTTEIMIGRGNEAYIYLDHLRPSDPLELALCDNLRNRLAPDERSFPFVPSL
jgi:hypothetical protein